MATSKETKAAERYAVKVTQNAPYDDDWEQHRNAKTDFSAGVEWRDKHPKKKEARK